MKIHAFYTIRDKQKSLDIDFNHTHMYMSLKNNLPDQFVDDINESSHLLLLDTPEREVQINSNTISQYRSQGGRVILFKFDPFIFRQIDTYIDRNLLDMVVLFDKNYKHRFPIKTYVSDYFFNEKVFPEAPLEYDNAVCVFGHLLYNRPNTHNVPKIDSGAKSYSELYKRVQTYNGVAVYDTGLSEDGSTIIQYNKAKAVETLMCGRNPYCKSGINTINYNQFLQNYDQIPTPVPVNFSQSDIFDINKSVIEDLIGELHNV